MSIFVARFNGFLMDMLGRETGTVLLVNLFGMAVLVATAYIASWFKGQPWRERRVS